MNESTSKRIKHPIFVIFIVWAIVIIICGYLLHYASENPFPQWLALSLPWVMIWSGIIPLFIIASKTNYKMDKGNLPGIALDQQNPVLAAIMRRSNPESLQKLTWTGYFKARIIWWFIGFILMTILYLFFFRII